MKHLFSRVRQLIPFAPALGIRLTPVPAGLTAPARHLFAVFFAAIAFGAGGCVLPAHLHDAGGGVLYPIVLPVAQGADSRPGNPEGRRLGGYLMFCTMASLAVSSALWVTATSANPIGIQMAREFGLEIGFGK